MTPTEELVLLYEQWHQLTRHENALIEAAEWSRVEQCQAAKLCLQPRITEISRRVSSDAHDKQFRPILQILMELELQNASRLRQRLTLAEAKKLDLDKSSRNLRQIHRSYVPPLRMNWQSYS